MIPIGSGDNMTGNFSFFMMRKKKTKEKKFVVLLAEKNVFN